jgi:hypothetical protein
MRSEQSEHGAGDTMAEAYTLAEETAGEDEIGSKFEGSDDLVVKTRRQFRGATNERRASEQRRKKDHRPRCTVAPAISFSQGHPR